MTIEEGFKLLTDQYGWYSKAGLNQNSARTLKKRFKKGKLDLREMIDVLKAARYFVKEAECEPPKD